MSELSAFIGKVARSEIIFEDYLRRNYDLSDSEIRLLLEEIKNSSFRRVEAEDLWGKVFGTSDYKAPSGIPANNIYGLMEAWRHLRELEITALYEWKSIFSLTYKKEP